MPKDKRKRKYRTAEQETVRVAKAIGLDPVVIANDDLVLAPVANWTEADQRHMVRSNDKNTVRKLTRIEKLKRAGTIKPEEAAICEWYAAQHALGYDTIGCTANYQGAGGGGFGPADLLARYRAQIQARENYSFARSLIPPSLVQMFEGVVLHGKTLVSWQGDLRGGRSSRASFLSSSFRQAVAKLNAGIGHLIEMEA